MTVIENHGFRLATKKRNNAQSMKTKLV